MRSTIFQTLRIFLLLIPVLAASGQPRGPLVIASSETLTEPTSFTTWASLTEPEATATDGGFCVSRGDYRQGGALLATSRVGARSSVVGCSHHP